MTDWISNIVVTIVVAVGFLILYKALKEPVDMLFKLIGNLFGWGRDKVTGAGEDAGDYYNSISYG